MRRSGWVLPGLAGTLWLIVIGWPLIAGSGAVLHPATDVEARGLGELMLTTGLWSVCVAVIAVLLGWLPGRWLGTRSRQGRGVVLWVALIAPVCLPAYLVFFAWWQSWPPDSWVFRWAVESGRVTWMRNATLLLGLSCWSWPLVAWCVAGEAAARPRERDELLQLDAAPWRVRILDHLRTDGRGLALGGVVVFLVTFGNTTSFDLAQVFSVGNELRAIRALGAGPREVVMASMPSAGLTVVFVSIIWFTLIRRRAATAEHRPANVSRPVRWISIAIWVVSVACPLTLLLRQLAERDLRAEVTSFWHLYGEGFTNGLGVAGATGALALIIAMGLAPCWGDHRRWVRAIAHGQALGWLVAAALPGILIAVALEAAWNRGPSMPQIVDSGPIAFGSTHAETDGSLATLVYRRPVILVLGHLARFGFIAALLGRWLAMRAGRRHGDLCQMDAVGSLPSIWKAFRPRLVACGLATFCVVAVMSMGEIPVTSQVRPPGVDMITTSMLNDMHYQRPQTVMIAAVVLLTASLLAAAGVALGRRIGVRPIAIGLVAMCSATLAGCSADVGGADVPLNTAATFGSPGIHLGQFAYPRAIAIDAERERVYVIDKTARIQRFDLEGNGEIEWSMPARENGKPTGLNVGPDGRVYVADTHYFRIIVYEADGTEVMRFGEYGQEPGQFIYPTDVEFGRDGRLYVSEYGGNDRIQMFSPDGEYLGGFGTVGEGEGEYSRPQSMVFDPSKTELFIADSCNHRIVVTDTEGEVLRTFGTLGSEAGALSYPYDLVMLDDGSLLVCEFGNSRVQRMSPTGESLGVWGRVGRGVGELQYPWGIDRSDDRVYVLDSGNNRVQEIRSPV